MNTLKNIWAFLNGKKTVVGSLFVIAALGLNQLGLINNDVTTVLFFVGLCLGAPLYAVGMFHKAQKWKELPGDETTE